MPNLTSLPNAEERALTQRIEERRLALSGDQASLRLRYEEVMRWVNPPWDPFSRRLDPRPEEASAARAGQPKIHVDLVQPAVTRWAALQAGIPVVVRCAPKYVPPPPCGRR